MRATFTDEQEQLAATARDLAADGRSAARRMLEGADAPQQPTQALMEGFGGLAVPESEGGLGGTLVDLAIVLEALGRQVTPTPWVSHVLATQVARTAGLDVSTAAGGAERWALGTGAAGVEEVRAVRDGDTCDAVVVVTGEAVTLARPADRRVRETLDATRPLADVRIESEVLDRADGGGEEGVHRAAAALSAELVGVGRGAVELAVEHARAREQFGQVIGRFQAVAHQLADAWTGIENAWSLALYACWAVSDGDPGVRAAVHAAKGRAGEAAVHAAERATQVHGGIGITWEADPHLYLRRALASEAWLGSGRAHWSALGDLLVQRR